MSKLYIDYMKEISKDDLYEGLLCHGLFADKLPPIFSNIDFYNACINGLKLAFTDEPNDYIRYNSTRNTNVPRLLGIPTPFTYLRLCNVLYDNWDKLINFFDVNTKNQRFKYSQIHIQKLKDKKAIFEMNHDYNDCDPSLELELCRLSIVKKYQVKADISSCFPSIYSHALTWAINGKDGAKYNQKDKKDFANTLDKCSRQLKNNETNGLLIGPHTSNLLSEIILCSVDKALADKGYEFIRHIDDYCCYLESEEQAEQFILDLSNELRNMN